MNRFLRYFLISAFIALAFYVITECSENASAAECTWKQASGSLASVNGNWENGTAPTTGDNVYFTSLSTAACTWDITATINYFSIGSGYSGTITQGSNAINIGSRGVFHAGGTFTTLTTQTVTVAGDWVQTGGTLTQSVCCVVFTGSGKAYTSSVSGNTFYKMTFNADFTINTNCNIKNTLVTANGITLNIATGKILLYRTQSTGNTFTNSGTIAGGSFYFYVDQTDMSVTLGTISSMVRIATYSGTSASRTLTFTGNAVLGLVTIQSEDATKTVTMALAGYSCTCTGMNVNIRAIISGSGSISDSGNFDSYNGTTSGSWSLTMTGTNPYIKTAAGNTINGLTWTATNLRFASSLNVTKTFYVGGTSTVGSYYIAVKNGCNVTVTSGNTWTLMGQTRYWNRVIIAGTLTCPTSVSIWCNSTVYFNGTVNNNIVLHCNGWVHSMGGYVGNIWIETAYRNYIYYNGTFVRLNWNLTTSWILVEGFTPNPGDAYSKAGTMSIVTSIGHWMNISSLAGSPFIIDLVTWSILEGSYSWHITNLGATTVFTFSLYLAVDEVDMSVYRNNVFMEVLSVEEGGYLSFYDTIAPNVETSYLLVPGAANASAIDWYLIGFCLAILALLSYMGLKNENFMIIAGLGWIAVSVLEFQPIQNTVALIALGVGIIFAVWGAYKYAYG